MAIALRRTHLFLIPLIVFLWSLWIPADSHVIANQVEDISTGSDQPTIVEQGKNLLKYWGNKIKGSSPQELPLRKMYLEVRYRNCMNGVSLNHYICEQQPEPVTVKCKKLHWQKDIQQAYSTANFFVVTGLKSSRYWKFELHTKLPEVLMLGFQPDSPIKGLFEATCDNFRYFDREVYTVLVPEFLDPRFADDLLKFYCINDLQVFSTLGENYQSSAQVYWQTLKKVIDFYEHPPAPTSPARASYAPAFPAPASPARASPTAAPSALDPGPLAPNPSAPARTTSRTASKLSRFRSSLRRKLHSPSVKKTISRLGSKAKNGMNRALSRKGSSDSSAPPPPRYIVKPSATVRLPAVVKFLMGKMIDPCMISKHKGAPFYQPGLEPNEASQICNIYCKFLSIAAKLSTERGPEIEACKQLDGKGECHEAVCSCQLYGTTENLPWGPHGHMPMFAAHNILRIK